MQIQAEKLQQQAEEKQRQAIDLQKQAIKEQEKASKFASEAFLDLKFPDLPEERFGLSNNNKVFINSPKHGKSTKSGWEQVILVQRETQANENFTVVATTV